MEEDDIIHSESSKQAEEDGILVDITKVNERWKDGLFNYITLNLLSKGYLKNNKLDIPNLLDLLNQALYIMKTKSNDFKTHNHFYAGKIEFPNGDIEEIFIAQNETGKYTLMMPDDY